MRTVNAFFTFSGTVVYRALARPLHGKPAEMRSRAGKEFTHFVYADEGVAYSAEDDELRFVEVFPAHPLAAYLEDIYRDPGPFIRWRSSGVRRPITR